MLDPSDNRFELPGSSRLRGFTLVEVMVASGITIFLVGLFVVMITAITSGWQRIRGSLSTEAQARMIFEQLTIDLEGGLYKPNGAVWLAFSVETTDPASSYLTAHGWQRTLRATLPSHTVMIKPGNSDPRSLNFDSVLLADARYGQAGGWLRFFTTIQNSNSDDETLSAPTAVAYQIVRRNVSGDSDSNNPETNPAEIRYQFFRSVVRPIRNGTEAYQMGAFDVGFDLLAAGYNSPDGRDGSPGSITKPNRSTLLANNVIDFGVRLYFSDGPGERLIFPSDGLGNLGSHEVDAGHFADSDDTTDGGLFPNVAEIMVRILTDEGARRIQNLEAGRIEGDWWEIAEANSFVYIRRIQTLARFPND